MEERRKKRSPRGQPAPARASRLLPTSKSASFALPLPALPSQHARPQRSVLGVGERPVLGERSGARGAPLQHSFLTEVSDVCEMEGGLLGLLSDFHSGKLQAFGKECSFEQLEHVREMQEKLARLHFGLDVCVEELPEEQKKPVADRNLDQLLAHVSGVSSPCARPCSADGRPRETGRTGRDAGVPPGPPCGADGGDARSPSPPPPAAILIDRTQRRGDVIGRRGDVIGRRPSSLRTRWRRCRVRGRRARRGGGCCAR
uniref:Coiled-coil domain containing 28B n=1 Tax=Phasianus colchicus TaxID=9054 RepID=A0A669PNF1_PHACC